MKFAPLAAALLLGAAFAVAVPSPAAAAPCLDLPAATTTHLHAPAGDSVHFEIPGLCYDLLPVVTPLDNPDGMTFAVLADGSPTAGIAVTAPAGFTGETKTRVELDFGGKVEVYDLNVFFGPLPKVTFGTPPAYLPIPAPGSGQVDLPVPGYAIESTSLHYVSHYSYTPIPGTVANIQAPGVASQKGGLRLTPWPTESFEFRLSVDMRSEYGLLGSHVWVFTFGDPPLPPAAAPTLAETGAASGWPEALAAAGAVSAIAVGALLVRARHPRRARA